MDATDAYAQQLRALWVAAGRPTADTLDRQGKAQVPPLRIRSATWSDWLNGKRVPRDAATARWLVEDYLRPLARRKSPEFTSPPAYWWERTRAIAQSQRSKGGRPATGHPAALMVEEAPMLQVGLIPPQADCFQNRDVAAALEAAGDNKAASCQVLEGMGGVGKTQLAAAYARRARDRGAEVLVWVTASSRPAIIDAYADAAMKLDLAAHDGPERAAKAFLEWATTTNRPWLLVLDDVQSRGDLRGLWPPASPIGTTVVTTRRRGLSPPGLQLRTIEVETFTQAEARSYLRAKLGELAADANQLDALIDDLGCLPLAFAQAAAFILDQDVDCVQYRALLRQRLLAHAVPEPDELPDEHHNIIAAAWDLSIEQADQARPKNLARPLLQLASVLDANGIPAAVLASQPARDYLASYLHAADAETRVTVDAVDEALRTLHRFRLITHDRNAVGREVRVHQLIQRATRDHLVAEPRYGPDLCDALAETAADALLVDWPQDPRDHLGQVLRANTIRLHATTGRALWHDQAHPVLRHAAMSLGFAGQVKEAVQEYTRLHTISCDLLGPEHSDTLGIRGDLAHWRGEAGDAAGATAAYKDLLTVFLRLQGPDHPGTLMIRSNLAHWRGNAGDVTGAAAAFEELLADQIRLFGPDHRDSLLIRSNLAHWRGAAGDLTGAIAAWEELLAIQVRLLGPDHPETYITLKGLANNRGQAGDAAGAAKAYEDLLTVLLEKLGPDHPFTLILRQGLASWRGHAGNSAGAATSYEQILTDQLRFLGPDNLDILTTRHNLALWRGKAGDAAGAKAVFEELLADEIRLLGPDHPKTLTTRSSLAFAQGEAGDTTGAVAAYEELLADQLRVLGPDHPKTLITRNNLANFRWAAGPAADAVAEFEELLADQLRVLGPDHPNALACRTTLALLYYSAGDLARTTVLFGPLLADSARVLGEDHPEVQKLRMFWKATEVGKSGGKGARTDLDHHAALTTLPTDGFRDPTA
jgi:hypothetical protein